MSIIDESAKEYVEIFEAGLNNAQKFLLRSAFCEGAKFVVDTIRNMDLQEISGKKDDMYEAGYNYLMYCILKKFGQD